MSILRERTERLSKFSLIAQKARENPEEKFTSLAHYLTEEYLIECYRNLNKTASSGIDKVEYYNYELDLMNRIESLHGRLQRGEYEAPSILRVWIDKDGGKKRPLGISCVEDKIVQKAVTGILSLIYEQDFYDFSYGFRPKRSAHQAISLLYGHCIRWEAKWLIDADIQGCFDNFDHDILMEMIRKRIKDKSILRLIVMWLKTGIADGESMHINTIGTPQGNIISPMLSNIYLHYVLDKWIEEIKPLLKRECFVIRFADDFVIGFKDKEDASRVMSTLPKRMGSYGLTIHPEKSKLINFVPEGENCTSPTFDFLGFTHYWTKGYNSKKNVVRQRTRKKSFQKSIKKFYDACKKYRHEKIRKQFQRLKTILHGTFNYFGIEGNYDRISAVYRSCIFSWFKWLNRRGQRKSLTWEKYSYMLERLNLPKPKIVHKFVKIAS